MSSKAVNGVLSVRIPYEPREWTRRIRRESKRFTCLLAHRGSGKSFYSLMTLVERAMTDVNPYGLPSRYMYVAKSLGTAKQLVWHLFKTLLKELEAAGYVKFNANDLSIQFGNGNEILLGGLDDIERNRGTHLTFLIIDESQMLTDYAWFKVFRPMLNANQGGCLLIGTPAGPTGPFYEMWCKGTSGNKFWSAFTITKADTGNTCISDEDWEEILETNDESTIQQEYFCNWNASLSARVYSKFTMDNSDGHPQPHVRKMRDRLGPVWVGLDFNFGKYVALLAQKTPCGTALEIFKEVVLEDATTDVMGNALRRELGFGRDIYICPDASGANAGTAQVAGSNHHILRNMGFEIRSPKKNPRVMDRVLGVCLLIENAAGHRRLFVDPSCTELLKTLQYQQYKNGEPDKKSGTDHAADALGYLVNITFPVRQVVHHYRELSF